MISSKELLTKVLKALDRRMVISNIHLVEKSGGRSGLYKPEVKAKPKKAIKTMKSLDIEEKKADDI